MKVKWRKIKIKLKYDIIKKKEWKRMEKKRQRTFTMKSFFH